MALSNINTYQIGIGNPNTLLTYSQASPDTATTSATLTTSQLTKGLLLVNQGGGAGTSLTLPSASVMNAAFVNMEAGACFDLKVVNISTNASEDATFVAGTGWTTYGNLVVASNNAAADKSSGIFQLRKASDSAWELYRLS